MIDADLLARELDEALKGRREIQPLSKTHGEFDLALAYDVQARGIKLFRQDEAGAVDLKFFRNRWEARWYPVLLWS